MPLSRNIDEIHMAVSFGVISSMSWFPLLHISITGDKVRARSWFEIQIVHLTRKKILEKYNGLLLNVIRVDHSRKIMRISPHLWPCCSVLTALLNLANLDCQPRRDGVSCSFDIFRHKYKRPHHATWNISNAFIETKYHLLLLRKKNPTTFEQECMRETRGGGY